MAVTRALSREERFERHIDEATSSLLVAAARRAGNAEVRLLAIEHAIEVNRKRDEWHGFGKSVVDKVVAAAMPDYVVRTGIVVPGEGETQDATQTQRMGEEKVKVLRTVMRAIGMEESPAGELPGPIDIHRVSGDVLPYMVSFDLRQPGVAYVEASADVIAHDRDTTLFI